MTPTRNPLQPLTLNALPASEQSPSFLRQKTPKLAPIFTPSTSRSTPSTSHRVHALRDVAPTSITFEQGSSPRKRVKRDTMIVEDQIDQEEDDRSSRITLGRKSSMMTYFCPSTPSRDSQPRSYKRVEPVQPDQVAESSTSGLWRRKRGRLGISASRVDSMLSMSHDARESP